MRIPGLNLEILGPKEVKKLDHRVNELETALKVRPALQAMEAMQTDYAIVPKWETDLRIPDMQKLSKISSFYRQIVSALQWELFRRGAEFEPKFVKRCPACKKEFETDVKECDDCKAETKDPNYLQIKDVKEFVEKCNENGQSLIEVCRQLEFDLDTVDNGYLILTKAYLYDAEGEIYGGTVEEAVRADPAVMMIIADKLGRLGFTPDGQEVKVCPDHRETITTSGDRCSICEKKLHRAHYVNKMQDRLVYYIKGEVIHATKFNPSLTYGYPPFLSLYQKVKIELDMDWFIRKSYEKGRNPNGWMFVKTKNRDSLGKVTDEVLKKIEKNPHTIIPIAVDSDAAGKFVEYIDLMKPLTEMQAVEFRNVMRREMGSLFGVMPIFQGDLSASGGLNNEGLQMTVTNRAMEVGQSIYNNKVFPAILKQFGVEDFEYKLLPSEEKDEMAELQREQLEIQNAQMMVNMGFDVKLIEDGSFEYSGEANRQEFEGPGDPPFGLEPTFGGQRFGGEPQSVRRLVKGRVPQASKDMLAQAGEAEKSLEELLEEVVSSITGMKQKPSRKAIAKLVNRFGDKIRKKTKSEIKEAYVVAMDEVEKELNMNIVWNKADDNAIDVLSTSRPLTRAYANMDDRMSKKLNKVITNAFENPKLFTIDRIVSDMKEAVDSEESQLRKIARTETTKVSNLARFNSYSKADPKGKKLYKWIGPADQRTTPLCKKIKKLTEKGVTLQKLKRIIHETAKGFDPKFTPGEFLPHIQCRHTFVRKV